MTHEPARRVSAAAVVFGIAMLVWHGSALADTTKPVVRVSLAVSPVSGAHSVGQFSSRIQGEAVLGSLELHWKALSAGVDGLWTSPLSLNNCCTTRLGALAPYIRADLNRTIDLRAGEYVVAQSTAYQQSTLALEQNSRLAGGFLAVGCAAQVGLISLSLDIAAAPALHGRISTRFPPALAGLNSDDGEHGSLLTFKATAAKQVGQVSVFAGVMVVNFAAYFDSDGKLADRNSGILPMIGIGTRL